MEKIIQQPAAEQPKQELSIWFDNMITQLRVHELMIKQGIAPQELEGFYQDIIGNDFDSHIKAQIPFIHIVHDG